MFVTSLFPPGLSSNWLTLVCTSCATRARRRGEVTSRWSLASGRLRNYSANRSHLLILTWSPLTIKESNTKQWWHSHWQEHIFTKKYASPVQDAGQSLMVGSQKGDIYSFSIITHEVRKTNVPDFVITLDFALILYRPISTQLFYNSTIWITIRSWSAAALGVWQTITKTQGMS